MDVNKEVEISEEKPDTKSKWSKWRPPVKAPVNGYSGIVPEEWKKCFGRVREKLLRVGNESETLDSTGERA